MPSSGEISKSFGIFKTLCCEAKIIITTGAIFPHCPNHKNPPTEWKQIAGVDPPEYRPNAIGKKKGIGKPA
jgi:hypothetical protein